ncbi:hypothetical protein [Actinoplanes sp. NPDC020271]|uniref:hypothetical protein n=1 Tax=Actinoplanes sp. NPDC020271 TaxID=3363896 RepID=UPI003789AE01
MDRLADQIDQAVAALTTMDRRVPQLLPAAAAFGADDTGRPGRLGRQLHDSWTAVLQARAEEAAGISQRLSDLAQAVRSNSRGYAETDETVRRRFLKGL